MGLQSQDSNLTLYNIFKTHVFPPTPCYHRSDIQTIDQVILTSVKKKVSNTEFWQKEGYISFQCHTWTWSHRPTQRLLISLGECTFVWLAI